MKIELKKETRINGSTIWYVEVDGKFVDNSLRLTEKEAIEVFNHIVTNKGDKKIETIKTTEI